MAPPNTATIDAVLPLVRDDLDRARILLASLDRYFSILGNLWIVTPDEDEDSVRAAFGDADRRFVIAESSLVSAVDTLDVRPSGWFVQQLIKLAIADVIDTDFYLTLDADVICIGSASIDDFIVAGRAVTNRRTGTQFEPQWYDWAERVLDLPRSRFVHGVTPAVLSVDAVRALQSFLGAKWGRDPTTPSYAAESERWQRYLLSNLPWTEYTLYFSYLEATGSYDAYHFPGESGADTIYGNSIWLPHQRLDEWDAAAVFAQDVPYQFVVIQSNHPAISTADVWEKVGPFLQGETADG